jgi:DNA-binding MarR family transcriptional regulator
MAFRGERQVTRSRETRRRRAPVAHAAAPASGTGPSAPLGSWLRYVSNHVSQALSRKLAANGVTLAEWTTLRTLHGQESISPGRLAQLMEMTPGAITRLADRLVGKSLVVRLASPRDGRAQTLALTKEGSNLAKALAVLAIQNDAQFFGRLPEEDRETLERLLRALIEHRAPAAAPQSSRLAES